jgi:hypothetical protein
VTASPRAKCDTPVELPGGLTAGCTLLAPHPDEQCKYEPPATRFDGRVVLCPVCSTLAGTTDDGAQFECENCETPFALSDSLPTTTATAAEQFSGAIVSCPLCQTPSDAAAWGQQTAVCPSPECGAIYTAALTPAAVRNYSMW